MSLSAIYDNKTLIESDKGGGAAAAGRGVVFGQHPVYVYVSVTMKSAEPSSADVRWLQIS